jgi:hypothetical protein
LATAPSIGVRRRSEHVQSDAQGRIRHHQFGEGGYEPAEMITGSCCEEPRAGRGLEAVPDWGSLGPSGKHVRSDRTENSASPGGPAFDKACLFRRPLVAVHGHLPGTA